MDKKIAERIYDSYLSKIEKILGHNTDTSESELKELGKKLFPSKFRGVFARDDKYDLTKPGFYIINNNTRVSGGEHWESVVISNGGKDALVYDSFARPGEMKKIMHGKKYTATENDVEQGISESNCGHRAIAFLCVANVSLKLAWWI